MKPLRAIVTGRNKIELEGGISIQIKHDYPLGSRLEICWDYTTNKIKQIYQENEAFMNIDLQAPEEEDTNKINLEELDEILRLL